MTEYVAGFLFDETMERVALVKKNRPAWQAGFFNAIGGHIEVGETPDEAMRREFCEEAGVAVDNWRYLCMLSGDGWTVHFFFAVGDLRNVHSCTDEMICVVDARWHSSDRLPNLRWLIPMAISLAEGKDRAAHFAVDECYQEAEQSAER